MTSLLILIITAFIDAVLFAIHRVDTKQENLSYRAKQNRIRAEAKAHRFMRQNPNYSPRKG